MARRRAGLSAGLLTPGPTAQSRPVTTAVVTADALNVRDGASLDAAVIDTLSWGVRLEVLGDARNGFTPICHGTGQAWMASEFLTVDGSPGATAWRSR
ncbi:MAG: SH3 domain-containing protein, partial [Chloroflexota bacterium]|nr:SH3 domain-containing protein [Chloroflexota bacterium]